MMKNIFRSLRRRARFLLSFIPLLLAACSGGKDFSEIKDTNQIAELENELRQGALDLSNVVVVRMKVDGKPAEASSIMPLNIPGKSADPGSNKTTIKADAKKNELILFTFDATKSLAYLSRLDLNKRGNGAKLVFPVAEADRTIQKKTIEVEKVLRK